MDVNLKWRIYKKHVAFPREYNMTFVNGQHKYWKQTTNKLHTGPLN